MTSNSPEVPDEENYYYEANWYEFEEDECKHCNGTGLSDFWDEESYCLECQGQGYLTWL